MQSFAGVEVNSDGEQVYHFWYWVGSTPGCPICGHVLADSGRDRTSERVKNHLKVVHYYDEWMGDDGKPMIAKIMLDLIKQ